MTLEFYLAMLRERMSRTLIVPALRQALACKGHSVRALGQTLSDFLGNIKVLDILFSNRGVDGCGGLLPRHSSLVLLGIRCEVGGVKGKS